MGFNLFGRRRKELSIRVSDIMSVPPIVAHYTTPIADVAKLMYENRIGSVMLVDDNSVLVGILTERDLVKFVASERASRNDPAYTIMSRNPVTIDPNSRIYDALRKMREYNIRHLPVVDKDGKPLGMISLRDLIDLTLMLAT